MYLITQSWEEDGEWRTIDLGHVAVLEVRHFTATKEKPEAWLIYAIPASRGDGFFVARCLTYDLAFQVYVYLVRSWIDGDVKYVDVYALIRSIVEADCYNSKDAGPICGAVSG